MENNCIYLKIVGSRVFAYGDMQSLEDAEKKEPTGRLYDKTVTFEEWTACGGTARVVAGKIVLGSPEEFALERNIETIRNERNIRLRACDKVSPMRWNAMTEAQRQAWTDYRQALLDIPQRPGFPWGGDVEKAPWPVKPE